MARKATKKARTKISMPQTSSVFKKKKPAKKKLSSVKQKKDIGKIAKPAAESIRTVRMRKKEKVTSAKKQNTKSGNKVVAQGKQYWLDDSKNVQKIFHILILTCIALVLADFFYHKHIHYNFENIFGFFGIFGFGLSFLLVLASRELRKLLMKDEDYYDQ